MEYAGKAKMGNSKVCLNSSIKVNNNVITKKHNFFPVTIFQAFCIRQRVKEVDMGNFLFYLCLIFVLILVALYQVGSRLRSGHVEFISEFYRWLAAEKSLVGGQ